MQSGVCVRLEYAVQTARKPITWWQQSGIRKLRNAVTDFQLLLKLFRARSEIQDLESLNTDAYTYLKTVNTNMVLLLGFCPVETLDAWPGLLQAS